MTNVTIINYNGGNVFSVARAFEHVGAKPVIAEDFAGAADAGHLVLPGVGAFGEAMGQLRKRGLDDAIREHVARGRPLLGICLGMQLLLDESTEFGTHSGLGIIAGTVERLPEGAGEKVPHIGWAPISCLDSETGEFAAAALRNIPPGHDVYFDHSYAAVPKAREFWLTRTPFGSTWICSALLMTNVVAYQFHPEKSGKLGLSMLSNFIALQ